MVTYDAKIKVPIGIETNHGVRRICTRQTICVRPDDGYCHAKDPLVWITVPGAGGRAGFGPPLVNAFHASGCRAVEMSFARLRKELSADVPATEVNREVVRKFWNAFNEDRPDLLLDISPIPAELVARMKERGTRTAFWLLEDALDPAYSYWKDTVPFYDLFFAFQGPPFEYPGCIYMPWGATRMFERGKTACDCVLLLGTRSDHRETFLRQFIEAAGEMTLPLRVIGPGWLAARKKLNAPSWVVFESRWLAPDQAANLLDGQVVLIPTSNRTNGVSPRVMDTMATGACVVTEDVPALHRHFVAGRDLLAFRDARDAARIVKELLASPARISEIARTGWNKVAACDTLTHRARFILEQAGLAS